MHMRQKLVNMGRIRTSEKNIINVKKVGEERGSFMNKGRGITKTLSEALRKEKKKAKSRIPGS